MPDDQPTNDVIDQRYVVSPEDTDNEDIDDELAEVEAEPIPDEADPADVMDQRRTAPEIDYDDV
ncbi:MAG TPA: hypothetical protein VF444_09590 [Pseudonocardiaceae bacterium]